MSDAGLPPDPWQAELLRADADRDVLLLAGRQCGKSTGTAFLAVKTALLTPKSTTLIVSPALRQSSEMLVKVKGALNALGRPVPVTHETASGLTLANGARVLSLPGSEATIRGYSANLVIADEAARIPDSLLGAIRPMLAACGGRFVALSSAFARSGWFFDLWSAGGPEWVRLSVKASECPRIPKEFLEQERKLLGEVIYGMEYCNIFASDIRAVFSVEDIERAVTDKVAPLFPTTRPAAPAPAGVVTEQVRPLFGGNW